MNFTIVISEKLGVSKQQQIVDAVSDAINNGSLKVGDNLPSVNELSKSSNVARDTVFRSYRELKKRGLIYSAPTKGYFVADGSNKVLLFLDNYSSFKDTLYHSFYEALPSDYSVDLFFHHYNKTIFDNIIKENANKYSHFVVMNYSHDENSSIINRLDPSRLLFIDWGLYSDTKYSYVCQDFNDSVYNALISIKQKLTKYSKLNLLYSRETGHPYDTVTAVDKFCQELNLPFQVVFDSKNLEIHKGEAYFTIDDKYLIEIVKLAKSSSFKVGEDIGIISFNDAPMKEIVADGITVMSTDFVDIGKKAAEFVVTSHPVKEIMPTRVILRNSL